MTIEHEHLGKVLEMTREALGRTALAAPLANEGTLRRIKQDKLVEQLVEALQVAAEALDNYADTVDSHDDQMGAEGGYPNEAMKALETVRAALAAAGGK